jgi:hypothetical protein
MARDDISNASTILGIVTGFIADVVIVGIETDRFGIDTATSSRLVSELVQARQ